MKTLKIFSLIVALGLISLSFQGCKKEFIRTTFENPSWTETPASYSTSMTTIIVLAEDLQADQSTNDVMAAFVGDDIRGVATLIEGRFFMMIKGTSDEQSMVTIKYYNSLNKYMYETEQDIEFAPDFILGTYDDPYELVLTELN